MRKLRFQKFLIILLTLALILTWTMIGITMYKTHHRKEPPSLDVLPYNYKYYALEYVDTDLSKQDIRIILNMVYDVSYTYTEQSYIGEDIEGIAQSNPNRITILDSIDEITYITVLSHELTHLKYKTSNETFTEYTSLVTLYETNINVFQKAALNKARFIISGGYAGTEHDCGYYLQKYFKNLL